MPGRPPEKSAPALLLRNMRRSGNALVVMLPNLEATAALGRFIAARARAGVVVLLKGPLGAGKTTLARAIIGAFLPGQEVPSPSFTLVQSYEAKDLDIVHFDLYRLESEKDLIELGWEDVVGRALVIVEWPELLKSLLPEDRLEITLALGNGEGERQARLVPRGRWLDRLEARDVS
jgi:tRNA threonylcarbamoyladenosine biosynthesis protein TsaE